MVIQGVIRPPPEIRAVADRTALYVAKNGRAFEKKILGSEKGRTPKFAFLNETSPFHAYYEQRVQFYEKGGEDEKEEKTEETAKKDSKAEKPNEKVDEGPRKEETAQRKASVVDPVVKALLAQRAKIAELRKGSSTAATILETNEENVKPSVVIPPPPPLQFVNIVAPASLSLAQIETIQLVAQFTALDGKGGSFLSQLSLREWRNPAFAFCQPRHAHFAYFTALVDAYRRILDLWTGKGDGAKEMANNQEKCLEVAAYRAEYERDQEEQANKRDEANVIAAQVDWHNFVVVETIDFPPDEIVEISLLPRPQIYDSAAAARAVKEEMEESDDEDEEQIRVVPSYKPKVVSVHESNKLETVIDPITGKHVRVEDMPEHMRIQLLDPKWAEERKKFQEKQKESNLVSGDVVASNLQRLARGDKFGKKEQDLLSGQTDAKKRLEEANRIIRDQNQTNAVGPTLPGADRKRPGLFLPPPAPPAVGMEPDLKRPRLEAMPTSVARVPPPPPPPPPPSSLPPEEPFAAVATGAVSQSDLLPEAEFAASLDKPDITLQVRIPNDQSQMAWNFYGQIVSLTVNVMTTVKNVKEEISRIHLNSIPANKIQLKNAATKVFLKDGLTLAALNIGPTATVEIVPRARGGRK